MTDKASESDVGDVTSEVVLTRITSTNCRRESVEDRYSQQTEG